MGGARFMVTYTISQNFRVTRIFFLKIAVDEDIFSCYVSVSPLTRITTMGWVYAIKCTATGEYYIGSTRGPTCDARFKSHLKNLKVGSRTPPKLQAAYDTHGRDALQMIP